MAQVFIYSDRPNTFFKHFHTSFDTAQYSYIYYLPDNVKYMYEYHVLFQNKHIPWKHVFTSIFTDRGFYCAIALNMFPRNIHTYYWYVFQILSGLILSLPLQSNTQITIPGFNDQ